MQIGKPPGNRAQRRRLNLNAFEGSGGRQHGLRGHAPAGAKRKRPSRKPRSPAPPCFGHCQLCRGRSGRKTAEKAAIVPPARSCGGSATGRANWNFFAAPGAHKRNRPPFYASKLPLESSQHHIFFDPTTKYCFRAPSFSPFCGKWWEPVPLLNRRNNIFIPRPCLYASRSRRSQPLSVRYTKDRHSRTCAFGPRSLANLWLIFGPRPQKPDPCVH